MNIIRTVKEIRKTIRNLKSDGKKVALVPTMGCLHAGHLSLVKRAEEIADVIIVSIFVNPTQFNVVADLESYPGSDEEDLAALRQTKTDFVYMPSVQEMYPDGFATSVTVDASEPILCDAHRPGHFDGVATVVSKLFIQTEADIACFGEKDYQQLTIVRRMAKDLNIPIEIEPVETVREMDGLAMSSRNARLTPEEREVAPQLHAAMQIAAEKIRFGVKAQSVCEEAIEKLTKAHTLEVEYFELRSGNDLGILNSYEENARLFAAAHLGSVRLIDNIAV